MNRVFLLVRIVMALLAWVLFIYWWRRVLDTAALTQRIIFFSLLSVGIAWFLVAVLSALWILHNKRLAKRGRRGLVSAYTPPRYEKDLLGRQLKLLPFDHDHAVIVVRSDHEVKHFLSEDEARGASR